MNGIQLLGYFQCQRWDDTQEFGHPILSSVGCVTIQPVSRGVNDLEAK